MPVPPLGWSHWLSARMFPPVALATGLAVVYLACWEAQFGTWTGPRLLVNLALAWVPYLCSLWAVLAAERRPHSLRPALPGSVVHLFPNPHLLTDWFYLDSAPVHAHLWSSIGLLTAFCSAGCFGHGSLYLLHAWCPPGSAGVRWVLVAVGRPQRAGRLPGAVPAAEQLGRGDPPRGSRASPEGSVAGAGEP